MSTAVRRESEPGGVVEPFREDGTFRLPLDMTPGRFRPRQAYKRPKFAENPVEFVKRRKLPSPAQWDRARQLSVMGDPLADDYAALYKKLGYEKARSLLDAALEHGIDSVPDAPPALKALFAEVDYVPSWVDFQRVERGAAVMRRYAPLTWLFARLAFAQTYVNGNAGLPLYMSGSLSQSSAAKRLKETERWRLGIQQPHALRRDGDGFKTIVRVRVLHGLIRYHLLKSGQWDVTRSGMPIPQIDMAGANLGMFKIHTQLLATLGIIITRGELSDVIHFWRYHGYLIGTVDDLNPKSQADLERIDTLTMLTLRGSLDPRGRELTQSTLNLKLRSENGKLGELLDYIDIRVSHGLYHLFNGPQVYEAMQLDPKLRGMYFLSLLAPGMFAADTLRRLLPGATRLLEDLGSRYIKSVMSIDEVKNAPFRPYHQKAAAS